MKKFVAFSYIILYILSFGGFGGGLHSQTITVKDKETGQVLQAVDIKSKNPLISTQTNAEGQADILSFKGLQEVEIIRSGYTKAVLSYEKIVQSNYVILLSPSPFLLNEIIIILNCKSQQNTLKQT